MRYTSITSFANVPLIDVSSEFGAEIHLPYFMLKVESKVILIVPKPLKGPLLGFLPPGI